MARSRHISTVILYFIIILIFSVGCAQTGGGGLVGGDKDESPPVILESTPDNYSTNFTGLDYEFVFDEYFELKDLKQKLLVSPPMEEPPDIKVKGKKLLIHFNTPLMADRTYTLNFSDALVDRNEFNPYENFQVVFSTGDEIDSLELSGRVLDAFTGEPAEGVSVMLYATDTAGSEIQRDSISAPLSHEAERKAGESLSRTGSGRLGVRRIDSLPLTTLPLYVSSTDEEGKYHLQNLAEGDYKIFALLDGNNNYLFDQPGESIAFLDSLVKGSRPKAQGPSKDEGIIEKDSISPLKGDLPETDTVDQVGYVEDSTNNQPDIHEEPDSILNHKPSTINSDSLFLHLFKESYQNQYISGTEKKRADKVQITFNQTLDTLDLDILYADNISEGYLVEMSTTKDTLICWMVDSILSGKDSLFFTVGYTGYDSLEQKTWERDTLRFNFKQSSAKQEEKNPMSLTGNVGRIMELGIPMLLSTGLPYQEIDTSKISLFRIRDSLEIPESFDIKPIKASSLLPGLIGAPEAQRQALVEKVFLQDSSYSLRFLPGAFVGFFGDTNDSLDINFRVNTEDKYGILVMNIDSLNEPAILQLLDSKDKPIQERHIGGSAKERFIMLLPGKYKFKLILDKNQNGKWETGRYLKNIQPEPILLYDKEITLKAKWEMEENWILNLE